MAITLSCTCHPDIDNCILIGLDFNLNIGVIGDGTMEWGLVTNEIHATGLSSGVLTFGTPTTANPIISLVPPTAWQAVYPSIVWTMSASSTASLGTHYPGGIVNAIGYLVQHWNCFDPITGTSSLFDIISISADSTSLQCHDGGSPAGLLEMEGIAATTVQVYNIYHSGPLADCTGISMSLGHFLPDAGNNLLANSNNCLCVTGGAAPFNFSIIAGNLSSGLKLDPSTGCVTGSADGITPGSNSVTYRVVDSTGATATTTCNYQIPCGAASVSVGSVWY